MDESRSLLFAYLAHVHQLPVPDAGSISLSSDDEDSEPAAAAAATAAASSPSSSSSTSTPPPRVFPAAIPESSLVSLQPGEWVADEVITAWTNWLNWRLVDAWPPTHVVSSLWYAVMLSQLRRGDLRSIRRAFARQIRPVQDMPAERQRLIFLIHGQSHWVVGEVHLHPDRATITLYDSLRRATTSRQYEHDLRWLVRTIWPDLPVATVPPPPLPQQQNGVDCGVFAMRYAETLALGGDPAAITQSAISLGARCDIAGILRGGVAPPPRPPTQEGAPRGFN